jgi:putative tryptophan/tyrosine transport system substrate-binding protein
LLAARHRLPAVYSIEYYVWGERLGHPMDPTSRMRAAGDVDGIPRGEKPSDLPVQASVKFRTLLNLKIAKALGIKVPPTVLVRADEVID